MAPDVVLHALDAAATQVCGGDLLFADRELHAVALARNGSNGLPLTPGKPREAPGSRKGQRLRLQFALENGPLIDTYRGFANEKGPFIEE